MRGWQLFGLTAVLSCSDTTLRLAPAWPTDRVVIVVEEEVGRPARAQVFAPHQAIILPAPEGRPVGLTVITYPPTDDPLIDPLKCGVSLDDSNPIVVSPDGAFVAPPTDWSLGNAPPFSAVEPASLKLPLGYASCVSDPLDCSRLQLEILDAAVPDADIHGMAVVSDDLIFYAPADGNVVGVAPFQLHRAEVPDDLRQARQNRILAAALPEQRARSLVFDGDKILGRTGQGEAFSVSLDGALTMNPRDPFFSDVAQGAGMVFEFGAGGIRQIGGTITTSIAAVYSVAAIAPDRIFASSDAGMLHYDGRRWNLEEPRYHGTDWRVAGDEDVVIATSDDGTILERNPETKEWLFYGTPFGPNSDPRVLFGLGKGRWMVGAQDGGLKIKLTTGRLCQLQTIGGNNFQVGARSASGRTFWFGLSELGSVNGDFAPLLRLRLPDVR